MFTSYGTSVRKSKSTLHNMSSSNITTQCTQVVFTHVQT